MLWGLFALSIPIIIHLLNRRRHRTVKWAAMDFLLKATRESRGKKKLKHILILTCRALAVSCLVFAISRPLLGGFLGFGATVDTVIFILDRSASMERVEVDGNPTKRELVLQQVSDAMAGLETAKLLLLDSATGQITEISSPETLPELSLTGPTDTAADLPSLFATTLDYIQEAQTGRTEIWLASDLQLADWKAEDSRWPAFARTLTDLTSPTSVRIIALPDSSAPNCSLRLISSRRTETQLTLECELARKDDLAPLTVPVTLNVNGVATTESLTMPGQTLRFRRQIPISSSEKSGWGYLTLAPDANSRDNKVFYTYGPPKPLQTLIVEDGSLSKEALDYLRRAVAPSGMSDFSVKTVSPEASELDFTEIALLIWTTRLPQGTEATLVQTFLESGGDVLFFPPIDANDQSFADVSWGTLETSPSGKFFIPGTWRQKEGPWRDGIDGSSLPVSQLRAIKRMPLNSDETTLALANWDDEGALLSRKFVGRGGAYFLSTLPDYSWSDLERSALHLALVQRLLEKAAHRLNTSLKYAGETPSAPATRLDPIGSNSFPYQSGVYQFINSESQPIALNIPPSELTFEQLDSQQISDTLFPNAPVSFFEQSSASNRTLLQEIWRPFLLACLLFLLAEAILTLNKPVRPKNERRSSKPSTAKA